MPKLTRKELYDAAKRTASDEATRCESAVPSPELVERIVDLVETRLRWRAGEVSRDEMQRRVPRQAAMTAAGFMNAFYRDGGI